MESDEVASRVNAANQEIRIKWYREHAPSWWWYFCKQVKGMLDDPLLEGKLEELCFEFYGTTVERMRGIIDRGPNFGRIEDLAGQVAVVGPKADLSTAKEFVRRAQNAQAEVDELGAGRKRLTSAEKMRAFRARKKGAE